MSDLAVITSKAVAAFSDLKSLRASVSTSASASFSSLALPGAGKGLAQGDGTVGLEAVIPEEALFSDFRSSLSTLVNLASMIESGGETQDRTFNGETSEIDFSRTDNRVPSSADLVKEQQQQQQQQQQQEEEEEENDKPSLLSTATVTDGAAVTEGPDDKTMKLLER